MRISEDLSNEVKMRAHRLFDGVLFGAPFESGAYACSSWHIWLSCLLKVVFPDCDTFITICLCLLDLFFLNIGWHVLVYASAVRTFFGSLVVIHVAIVEGDLFRDSSPPDSPIEGGEVDVSELVSTASSEAVQHSLSPKKAEGDEFFIICKEEFSDMPLMSAPVESRDVSGEAREQDMDISPEKDVARGCARDLPHLPADDLVSTEGFVKPVIVSDIPLGKRMVIEPRCAEILKSERMSPERKRAKSVPDANKFLGFGKLEQHAGPKRSEASDADKSADKWKYVIPEHIIRLTSNGCTDTSRGPFVVGMEKIYPVPSEKDPDLGVLNLTKHMCRIGGMPAFFTRVIILERAVFISTPFPYPQPNSLMNYPNVSGIISV